MNAREEASRFACQLREPAAVHLSGKEWESLLDRLELAAYLGSDDLIKVSMRLAREVALYREEGLE